MLARVCVFCGSSPGARAAYADAARAVGELLAERGIELVYGGGNVGLMGILADAALARGGHVIGVIPEALRALEVAHRGLPDLRVVASMHERKAIMADLSDAFLALPGGIGTLEELLEIATWSQLGLHQKPVGLLNVEQYFTGLQTQLDHAVRERFLLPEHRALIVVGEDARTLLTALADRPPTSADKWIDRDER